MPTISHQMQLNYDPSYNQVTSLESNDESEFQLAVDRQSCDMINTIGLGTAILAIVMYGLWTPDLERAELEKRYVASSPQMLDVDGLKVHYKETGPQAAPALLLMHGFGSSLQAWDDWSLKLEQKYRVIRLDLPGFGLTGASPANDYSEEKDLAILTHFADKLGLEKFSIIGHSMGGKMAWTLAATQPERVQALVLMAPDGFPEAKDIGTKPYEVPAVMGLIKYFLPKYLVRKSIEPAFAEADALSDARVNRYYDMLRAPGVRAAILERSNQTIYTDPVPRLKAIKAPTLLIWGEQDQMIPSTNAKSYASVLSNSTTVLVPKLGHLLQEEQPEKGLTAVMQFLDSHLKK
jgi:pimeloyl-ACP methyl ester carboxylesterase